MAVGFAHWWTNRPERDEAWEAGDQEVEFGERSGFDFRIPYEYLSEFFEELRGEFDARWTRQQVATLAANVADERHPHWSSRYVVTREGVTDEMSWRFCRVGRDRVQCSMEGPQAFVTAVRGIARHYPAKAV